LRERAAKLPFVSAGDLDVGVFEWVDSLSSSARFFANEAAGLTSVYSAHSVGTAFFFALAGPIGQMSLAALVAIGVRKHLAGVEIVGVLWIISGAVNLVPHQRHGHCNDGWHALEALRRRRARIR
jgi:hypothetical protein